MEYLHALTPAIIHRDLKSLNVLRSVDGVFKVCDFGLVRNRNIAAGTPNYMAPGKIINRRITLLYVYMLIGPLTMLWEFRAFHICVKIPIVLSINLNCHYYLYLQYFRRVTGRTQF
jgi:serine/threonine protein kinase